MVVKEEQSVGSSLLVSIYTDIEYLLTYAGQYRATYAKLSRLLEKNRQEDLTSADIPAEQQSAIITLTDTIRTQAYKIHMRVKALAPKLGLSLPPDLDTHFQELWQGMILPPDHVDDYVQDLMVLLTDQIFSDTALIASQTLKGLGE